MQIVVEYAAQLKRAAGVASETVQLESPCTVEYSVSRIGSSVA